MDRAAGRQFRCLLRQHVFQSEMAQQDSEHNSGTIPAEKRDLQSKTIGFLTTFYERNVS